MATSAKEQQQQRLPSSSNPAGKKRVDAALEKNIETIVTQVRRTTTKPSQLTQNDLQMFDSTAPTTMLKNSHHSRETTPITSSTASKQSSSSSREMTPDSINADSANEDQQQQQQPIRNGHHYQRSLHASSSSSSTVDLTSTHIPTYAPQAWPPAAAYPFAHQHPGLYLPYPPTNTSSTPTNGMPPLYPAYDPAFIEQHYGPQALAAYYSQQQARLLQEHAAMSGTPSSPTSFRESQSLTDLLNHPAMNPRLPHRIHPHFNEQQHMMFSHLYLNQIASLPYVTLYENAASARSSFRSNGEIGENEILIVLNVVHSCLHHHHHHPHVFSTCSQIVKTPLCAV